MYSMTTQDKSTKYKEALHVCLKTNSPQQQWHVLSIQEEVNMPCQLEKESKSDQFKGKYREILSSFLS